MTAIWLVTGVPGAGKSSVCRELASRYPVSVHVETDLLDETALHCRGAIDRLVTKRATARLALEYATAGVVVIVDDTLEDDADTRAYIERWPECRLVYLAPPLAIALARNAARTTKPAGDAPMLEAIARRLDPRLRAAHTAARGWLVVDSASLAVGETVDLVVNRLGG